MFLLTNIIRFLVGIIFIISGLVKANDPLGLAYKMDEFFEVWHTAFFSSYSLAFAILMIVVEVLLGVALIVGSFAKLTTRLFFLLNVFFLFLTAYATFSGNIKTCGCFGDCFVIPSGASFGKDIFLTLCSVLLLFSHRHIHPLLRIKMAARVLGVSGLVVFLLCLIVLRYLPFVDCLSFKKGVNITQALRSLQNYTGGIDILMYYQKDGTNYVFVNGEFPTDFDESYVFIRREERPRATHGAKQPDWTLRDFRLFSQQGDNRTQALLSLPKCEILFVRKLKNESINDFYTYVVDVLNSLAAVDFSRYVVVSENAAPLAQYLHKHAPKNYTDVLQCDNVLIKTTARAKATLYLLQNGSIIKKSAP